MSTTVTVDLVYTPKVTLTRDDALGLTAVIEVDGLEPQRETTAEERAAGIQSLNPPTVRVRALKKRSKTLRLLIDGGVRAVQASAASTFEGVPPESELERTRRGPGGLALSWFRIALAMRIALRQLDEDI